MEDRTVNKDWLVFRRRFFIVWLVFMIVGSSFMIATYGSSWRFFYNAKMTDFTVCSGLDSNGHPIPVTNPITIAAKEINVCGYLEGNGPTIRLGFDLQYNSKLVVNPMSGYYPLGYITARFVAPSGGFKAGNYLVLVYQGRHEVASTEFTIEARD